MSAVYFELLRAARRWTKTPEDARDLVQVALTEAVARGFSDWEAAGRRGWLLGVIRRQAAFQARGEARRRRRDQLWQLDREHPGRLTPRSPPALHKAQALAHGDGASSPP